MGDTPRVEGEYSLSRKIIDKYTKEWSPDLDTTLPIAGELDIPNFRAWINWNGFNTSTEPKHKGYDFSAYLTTENRVILGLPKGTKVRAVADGLVRYSARGAKLGESDYYGEIRVSHGDSNNGLLSVYAHVIPSVRINDKVKKGDIIGTLYASRGTDVGYLVHLHLQLHNSGKKDELDFRMPDPSLVDPQVLNESLYKYSVQPQGRANFSIPELSGVPVEIAHFKQLIVP